MPDAPYGHRTAGSPLQRDDSFCQSQAVVPVPPATVHALLSEVTRWPQRFPDITGVRAGLVAGTYELRFHGRRFDVSVTLSPSPSPSVSLSLAASASPSRRYEEPLRFDWSGVGTGVRLGQSWLLTGTADGGTHVVTEGVVTVSPPVSQSPSWAHRLNALWLAQVEALTAGDGSPDVRAGR